MQQHQVKHSLISSWDGWVMTVGVGLAASIACIGSTCWLSTLPITTPLTAVWTRTADLSSFSTTTSVVSLTNITAFPSSSVTNARSTRLAIPASLYNIPRNRIVMSLFINSPITHGPLISRQFSLHLCTRLLQTLWWRNWQWCAQGQHFRGIFTTFEANLKAYMQWLSRPMPRLESVRKWRLVIVINQSKNRIFNVT